MWDFVEYAARVRPQVAVFESVQLAYSQGGDLMRALRARLEELTGDKWNLYHVLHNALSVGGPAMRKRYFWVASRVPFGIEWPRLVEVPNLEDVIGDLRDLRQAWEPQRYVRKPSWYSVQFRDASRAVDGHVSVDTPHTRRTLELLERTEWQPNEHIQQVTRRHFDEHGELPPSWQHLTDKLKGRDFFQGFNTPIMWHPEHHARVVTGGALLHAIHWAERRMFTHREAARVLGFPDEWLIEPLRGVPGLFLTWGKGISVHCGRWIASWVKRALDGEPGSLTGELIGDRERLIDVTHAWRDVYVTVRLGTQTQRAAAKREESFVTEPTTEPTTEASTETTETALRGRPRPSETLERDEVVFNALTEPLSRAALTARLAEAGTPFDPKAVYLSIWRLHRAGRIERKREGGTHLWLRTGETPAE
jgi:site-specific DNA-cytosine methylase